MCAVPCFFRNSKNPRCVFECVPRLVTPLVLLICVYMYVLYAFCVCVLFWNSSEEVMDSECVLWLLLLEELGGEERMWVLSCVVAIGVSRKGCCCWWLAREGVMREPGSGRSRKGERSRFW